MDAEAERRQCCQSHRWKGRVSKLQKAATTALDQWFNSIMHSEDNGGDDGAGVGTWLSGLLLAVRCIIIIRFS